MPAEDGIWLNDEKRIAPFGPDPSQTYPEDPIPPTQPWPEMLPIEHGQLLT